jgi:transcriptional regulator with XRE-family HTH domain
MTKMETIVEISEFAKRLTEHRAARYPSAAAMARACDMPEHKYRAYERGDHLPPVEMLARICVVLHVSPNDLLDIHKKPRQAA